jgi:hypothetical protein
MSFVVDRQKQKTLIALLARIRCKIIRTNTPPMDNQNSAQFNSHLMAIKAFTWPVGINISRGHVSCKVGIRVTVLVCVSQTHGMPDLMHRSCDFDKENERIRDVSKHT